MSPLLFEFERRLCLRILHLHFTLARCVCISRLQVAFAFAFARVRLRFACCALAVRFCMFAFAFRICTLQACVLRLRIVASCSRFAFARHACVSPLHFTLAFRVCMLRFAFACCVCISHLHAALLFVLARRTSILSRLRFVALALCGACALSRSHFVALALCRASSLACILHRLLNALCVLPVFVLCAAFVRVGSQALLGFRPILRLRRTTSGAWCWGQRAPLELYSATRKCHITPTRLGCRHSSFRTKSLACGAS